MNRQDLKEMAQKERQRQEGFRCRLLCCASTPCLAVGAGEVMDTLKQTAAEKGWAAAVEAVSTGCMGPCSRGPLVRVQQTGRPDVLYERVTPELAGDIVANHVKKNAPLEENNLPLDLPFFIKQRKIVLENSGLIDQESLAAYVAVGGYAALAKVLREMTPQEVCDEIAASGLRGRGGAGYPTGLKWQLVRKAPAGQKYVIANCDEGDPGAYMDRTLVESDPHRLLEAMAIAGYAVGANQGFIFVRGGYEGADKRLQQLERVIREAERHGLLGGRVLDSSFSFRIDIRLGAGAFVCGEETALMLSIMGRRAQPVPRPPYPAESGLWGRPTLINNVETFGNIVPIIRDGAANYAGIGTDKSKGTKVFAMTGRVNIAGLIEVPMGISLREIVHDIGGGIPQERPFKAIQTGGPSGGCIPAAHIDTVVDYEAMRGLGSMIGSGGLIVMDDQTCMVDLAKFFMAFCADESCGKCVPCRAGTVQLLRLLERITNGSGTARDLSLLEELCGLVKDTSLCGLGQAAPNPVLSTLRFFREEYEAHLFDGERRCPAGLCKMDQVPIIELKNVLPLQIQTREKVA